MSILPPNRVRRLADDMKTVAGLLLVTVLGIGSGCASTDWIDRTLVTVDVTGTWYGGIGGSDVGPMGAGGDSFLELEQQGSTVKGPIRFSGGANLTGLTGGPINGTVAGDVFRFKDARGNLDGEVTVSGDEMNGRVSTTLGNRPFSLRRIDPPARPGSPLR